MRVPRQDELVEPELVVLRDALGHFVVRTDECRADSAPDHADAGPHVRVDLHAFGRHRTLRELGLAPLSNGRCAGEVGPCRSNRLGVHTGYEAVGFGPRLGTGRTADDVKTDAEAQRPSGCGGKRTHPTQSFTHHRRRLAPCEIHVDAVGRHALSGIGCTAEIDLGDGTGYLTGRRPADVVVRSLEGERLTGPRAAHHVDELRGPVVASLLVLPHPETGELGLLRARHDVDLQPTAGDPLVRRGHLGSERRRQERWTKGHEKLQPLGQRQQGRGGQPRVFAAGSAGSEHRAVSEFVARDGDLGEIAEVGRTAVGRWPRWQHIA